MLRDWQRHDKKRYTEIQLSDTYVEELIEVLAEASLRLLEKGKQQFRETNLRPSIDSFLSAVKRDRPLHEFVHEKADPSRLVKRFKDDGVLSSATSDGQELRFLHLTFQEYLAARALAKRRDCISIAMQHVYEPAWDQVLVMLGGILEEPGPYIAALLRTNREDLLCRPFLVAIQASRESGCNNRVPKEFYDGMACEVYRLCMHSNTGFLKDVTSTVVQCVPAVVERMVVEVRSRSSECRRAIHMLGKTGSEQAVPTLVEVIWGREIDLHLPAVEALGEIGSGHAISGLLHALQNDDMAVRRAAAWALGRTGSEKAVKALAEVLHDTTNDRSVRESAARALGEIGSAKAISDLLDVVLQDREKHVRESAASALGKVGAQPVIPDLLQVFCCMTSNRYVRASAARALGEIGSKEAIGALIEALHDTGNDRCVRESAVEALGKIGSERTISDLLKALQDQDRVVCRAAALALGRIGSEKAVAVVVKSDETVRFWN